MPAGQALRRVSFTGEGPEDISAHESRKQSAASAGEEGEEEEKEEKEKKKEEESGGEHESSVRFDGKPRVVEFDADADADAGACVEDERVHLSPEQQQQQGRSIFLDVDGAWAETIRRGSVETEKVCCGCLCVVSLGGDNHMLWASVRVGMGVGLLLFLAQGEAPN